MRCPKDKQCPKRGPDSPPVDGREFCRRCDNTKQDESSSIRAGSVSDRDFMSNSPTVGFRADKISQKKGR